MEAEEGYGDMEGVWKCWVNGSRVGHYLVGLGSWQTDLTPL